MRITEAAIEALREWKLARQRVEDDPGNPMRHAALRHWEARLLQVEVIDNQLQLTGLGESLRAVWPAAPHAPSC